jgi:hypothetical protein
MRKIKIFEEFIENSDNIIDAKMSEIKDLINGVGGDNLLYEWENKDNHELIINFTYNGLVIRYEFDIDDMKISKIVDNKIDFTEIVESIDEGLDIIEEDVYMILGVSESEIYEIEYMKYLESYSEFSDLSPINEGENKPVDASLWAQCKAWAKSKYDVWPSAYACGAAAKRYKSKGGKWKKKKKKK